MNRHLALLLLLPSLWSRQACACSCAIEPVNDQYVRAGTVVVAEPIRISTAPTVLEEDGYRATVHRQEVTWRVGYSWKGEYAPGETFVTRTTFWNGGCGVRVQRSVAMLLFLSGDRPTPDIGLCSGSRPLVDSVHRMPDLFRASGIEQSPPNYSLKRTDQSLRD